MRVFYFTILIFIISVINASSQDTIRKFSTEKVEIIANKTIPEGEFFYFGTDYNSNLFDKNGVSLIRRGLNFTQDVYSEGFKRGDIKIIIDGEQYHNACPNRMDAPASRINPLEMSSVEISKSGTSRGAGIYGKIEYHRKEIPEELKLGFFGTADLISQKNFDGGLSISAKQQALIARYSQGKPYLNSDSKTFKELYSYEDNFMFSNLKIAYRGNIDDFKYGVSFNQLENISFPYLQMDEKNSKIYNADFSYQNHKIYFNYTDHLMDNSLRVANSLMTSHAKNFTIGLVGDFYELSYRNWNVENKTINKQNNMVMMENDMMPNINQLYFAPNYQYNFDSFKASARAGLYHFSVGEKDAIINYKTLYSEAEDSRLFFVGAVNFAYSDELIEDFVFGSNFEIAMESPEAEQLFINVKRPSTNPNWYGNPTLKNAKKISLRATINNEYFSIEGYINKIYDYVYINSIMLDNKNNQTFNNIDAIILGINASFRYSILESNISYIYGENTITKSPLSEIMPLTITNIISIPEIYDIKTMIIHHYENYQSRIDKQLNEAASNSWNTIGLRVLYKYSDFIVRADVDNLLNYNYYRHLSYARNPFSSGLKVYEPGISLRLTFMYEGVF